MYSSSLKTTIRKVESFVQVVFLSLVYLATYCAFYKGRDFTVLHDNTRFALTLVYALVLSIIFWLNDSFKYGNNRISELSSSQIISLCLTNIIMYFEFCLVTQHLVGIMPIIYLTCFQGLLCVVWCVLCTKVYQHIFLPKNMLLIYGNDNGVKLKFKMDGRPDKYHITAVLNCDENDEVIKREILSHDAVVINDVPAQKRNKILKYCYANSVCTYLVPKISDIMIRGAYDMGLFDTPLFVVNENGLDFTQKVIKRLMDIVLSVIALIVAGPFMLVTAIAIKLEDGGPVFFKQKRVTIHNKEFTILKFRSMIVDADKSNLVIPTVGDDPRITKVGKIIRACRMDEMPQIFNILKGDMSIVGPRPERVEHVQKYTEEIPEFQFRSRVKGGLTGYAQIYGKYNTTAYDKLMLDLTYVENYSLLLDLKLILMTVRVLFSKESTEGFEVLEKLEKEKERLIENLHVEANTGK